VESIRQLFGDDVQIHDIKNIFNKISANPDAKVDWSEVGQLFATLNPEAQGNLNMNINIKF